MISGSRIGPQWVGVSFLAEIYRKQSLKVFSKSNGQHHKVVLIKVCSNHDPRGTMGHNEGLNLNIRISREKDFFLYNRWVQNVFICVEAFLGSDDSSLFNS